MSKNIKCVRVNTGTSSRCPIVGERVCLLWERCGFSYVGEIIEEVVATKNSKKRGKCHTMQYDDGTIVSHYFNRNSWCYEDEQFGDEKSEDEPYYRIGSEYQAVIPSLEKNGKCTDAKSTDAECACTLVDKKKMVARHLWRKAARACLQFKVQDDDVFECMSAHTKTNNFEFPNYCIQEKAAARLAMKMSAALQRKCVLKLKQARLFAHAKECLPHLIHTLTHNEIPIGNRRKM